MAVEQIGAVEKHRREVAVEKKVEVKVEVKPLVKENAGEKLGNAQFRSEQIRLKLNNQVDANKPTNAVDDQIKNLERAKRNLPPEDRLAIDRSIKGLELTRDAADPAKVRQMAKDLVDNNGGVDDFDSSKAGADLAEIARLSPTAGKAVLDETLKIVKTEDRDEIAQDFVENLSDAELSKLAATTDGKKMLETARYELQQGKVHDDEHATITRIDVALTTATQTQTQAVDAAAARVEQALESDVVNGGQVLASEIERLDAIYGPGTGGKLMSKVYADMPHELGASLRLMDNLPEAQKNNLGRALGQTFDTLDAAGKTEFAKWVSNWTVADAFTPMLPGVADNKASSFADLISRSFNTEMKTAVVNEMMAHASTIEPGLFGDNGGVDVQALFTGAAIIADSAPRADRAAMLQTIVETLPKVNLPSLIKDPATKDALSRLFMHSGADLLHRAAPDGAYASADFQAGMTKFLELTLFSEGPGALRPQMMEYMVKLTKDVGDAAATPPISQGAYEAAHGGWSQQDHVEAMSGLLAMTWKAAENQTNAIKADQKQREDTAKMFTGLAFSFVPGAGKVLGNIAGEGATFLEQIPDKIRDFAWDKAKGALESGVNSQLAEMLSGDSLANIDTMLGNLKNVVLAINASLPNGEAGELDLRSKFQSGFSFYQLI